MTTPLPPVSLYEQFYVVGIIILVLVVIGFLARRLFLDFAAWQAVQDRARADERDAQRKWMEGQDAKAAEAQGTRDKQWQEFFERMNQQNNAAIQENSRVIDTLVRRIDALTASLTDHDQFTRERLNGQAPRRVK